MKHREQQATDENTQYDDHVLLERIREDDQRAFQQLFRRYGRYTAAVAAKVGGSSLTGEDIEELCSDVFVKLWENRTTVRLQDDLLKKWLGTVARNMTLNLLRARNRKIDPNISGRMGEYEYEYAAHPSAEEDCLEAEEWSVLFEVIGQLPQKDRELFLLRYYYGKRVTELAKEKNMNVKTASARLIRIRNQLKKAVSERGIRK